MRLELAAYLGRQRSRPPWLGLRYQAGRSSFIDRVNPPIETHARHSQNLGDPTWALPLDDQQQGSHLQPDRCPGTCSTKASKSRLAPRSSRHRLGGLMATLPNQGNTFSVTEVTIICH